MVASMGLFYRNLTVHGVARDALVAKLKAMGRTAYVGATTDGCTVVFDKKMEQGKFSEIEKLATSLTGELGCTALVAILHDDDVLYLWLFVKGEACDWYDYFDPNATDTSPPTGGDAELICLAFNRLDHKKRVQKLLRPSSIEGELPKGWGEQERHRAIAIELGMPKYVAGVTYSSIAGDYVPKEFLAGCDDVTFEAI
jgi:hypothetical protein